MQKVERPFDMSEKLNPQSFAFVGAFNQAGNVGHYETLFFCPPDDAQIWVRVVNG